MPVDLHSPFAQRLIVASRWLAMATMATAVQRLAALTARWRNAPRDQQL